MRTAEQKQRARSVISLTMMVTSIALTGLLILIVAIAARGIARRLDDRESRAREQRRGQETAAPPVPADESASPSPDDGASTEQQGSA